MFAKSIYYYIVVMVRILACYISTEWTFIHAIVMIDDDDEVSAQEVFWA